MFDWVFNTPLIYITTIKTQSLSSIQFKNQSIILNNKVQTQVKMII